MVVRIRGGGGFLEAKRHTHTPRLPWNKTSCSKLQAGRVRVSLGKVTRWSPAQVKPTASPSGREDSKRALRVTFPKERFPFQAGVPGGCFPHAKGGGKERGFGEKRFTCGAESGREAGWVGTAADVVP